MILSPQRRINIVKLLVPLILEIPLMAAPLTIYLTVDAIIVIFSALRNLKGVNNLFLTPLIKFQTLTNGNLKKR